MTIYHITEAICRCGIFREANLDKLEMATCPDCGQVVKATHIGTQSTPFEPHFRSRFGIVQKYLRDESVLQAIRPGWDELQPEDATVAHCGRRIGGRVMPKGGG